MDVVQVTAILRVARLTEVAKVILELELGLVVNVGSSG